MTYLENGRSIQFYVLGDFYKNGYAVTVLDISSDFGNGDGFFTLHYYDGNFRRYNNNDVYSLCGETFDNVVSIELYGEYLVDGYLFDGFDDHETENIAFTPGSESFSVDSGKVGIIILGADAVFELLEFNI